MLYSCLAQLSTRAAPPVVTKLYDRCNKGTQEVTIAQLTDTLIEIADHGKGMYIITDALDESSDWRALLKVIKTILRSNVNLLSTSRKEREFQDVLLEKAEKPAVDYVVAIKNQRVDADVNHYVQRCLRNDPDLNKWDDELKLEILRTLTSGAPGM